MIPFTENSDGITQETLEALMHLEKLLRACNAMIKNVEPADQKEAA